MPLIRLLFEICTFRKGPQDIPVSPALLGLAILAYLLAGICLLGVETVWTERILRVVTEALLLMSFVWIMLTLMGKRARLLQTATAVYASDALISSMAVPVLALLSSSPNTRSAYLLLLVLTVWHWSILGHILRHALSVRLALGTGLALTYMILSYRFMALIFPAQP